MSRATVLALLLPALALPLPAHGQEGARLPEGFPELPVREHVLENGLRLLVLPRPTSPTVSFVVEYAVGGVNERLGNTGIAHFVEHLLFKGTTSVGTRDVEAERGLFRAMDAVHDSVLVERGRREPDSTRMEGWLGEIRSLEDSARSFTVPNEFDRILSRNGARGLNATTSAEATTYFVELPANRAKLWFILEADRWMNPVFREFHAEREVILEERRSRVETSSGGLLYEAHMGTAFRVHPYGVPVIGHRSDMENYTRREVEEYYRRYYSPGNAVVAVVGAVDPDSVLAWGERYLARVPPGDPPPPVLAREPEQRGERRVEVVFEAEPHLRVGWHTVDLRHPDAPALSMLTTLLVGGRTSRLYRRLVTEDRIATFVSASLGPGARFPLLFAVDATPRAPHTTAQVEEAIYQELERLAESGPRPEELERVRNQLEAARVRRVQSNLGLAFQLASSASNQGDWRWGMLAAERVREVTAEEVQRVVRRYFHRENRTVATLVRPREEATRAGPDEAPPSLPGEGGTP